MLLMTNSFAMQPTAWRSRLAHGCRAGSLFVGLALVACGPDQPRTLTGTPDEGYPGITLGHFTLLSTSCVVTATGVSVAVNAGETALVSLSLVTGNVTINGTQASGLPCEGPATSTVSITPGTAGDHGVVLDLSSGLVSQATTTSGPKIVLNLGSGGNDSVSVRGSAGVDHFYFGSGVTPGTTLFNFNGGASGADDAFADVSITGAEHVVVSTGTGNDLIDGSGLFGTTSPCLAALTFFGGGNDDTLTGGAGNDILSGDSGNDHLNGAAGANTYSGGASSDGSDIITVATGAIDTLDYSQRFNAVSVVLDNTAVSGETGENDTIPDTISVVFGGSGNDVLSAAASTRRHTLNGGPGNDTLIGGNGSDTLIGGNGSLQIDGDDIFIGSKATADYSARTQAVTVTMNAAGAGGGDANDGDPAATRHVQTAALATVGAIIGGATNVVTGLTQMNAGSVGHRLILAGSSGARDDGSYRIASVTNATTIVLDATDTAANGTWGDDTLAGWTFAEDAGAEKDEIRCRNIIGSAVAANTITGDGNDNWITGGAAVDVLVGGAGSDTLIGLAGDDTLRGGAGDDTLIGGPGNDLLVGGDGNDVLEGDANADFFQCDGVNDVGSAGSAPGSADYTVDYAPGAPDSDTRVARNDCEY
jgi:Ca2+-binding RTX toxin-like protein